MGGCPALPLANGRSIPVLGLGKCRAWRRSRFPPRDVVRRRGPPQGRAWAARQGPALPLAHSWARRGAFGLEPPPEAACAEPGSPCAPPEPCLLPGQSSWSCETGPSGAPPAPLRISPSAFPTVLFGGLAGFCLLVVSYEAGEEAFL